MNIRGIIGKFIMYFFRIFPIQNKIVFVSFQGVAYSDNPKAIFEAMLKEDFQCEYVWLLKNPDKKITGAKVVKTPSLKGFYHLATAKIWIDNSRKNYWLPKRAGQYYIQTWHSGIGLKKSEKDAIDDLSNDYIRSAIHDSKIADLFIAGSGWNVWNYRNAFWYNGEILECGLPRSDKFFHNIESTREKVKLRYSIDKDTKILLYAPTFRKGGITDAYNINFSMILKYLKKKTRNNWCVCIKLHPNISYRKDFIKYDKTIIDATDNSDINELLMASDMLITDYSSCMFDAITLEKPTLLYTADIDTYRNERSLYFEFEELPFLIAKNNEELKGNIELFDKQSYIFKVRRFKENHKIYDDGNACKCVIEKIKKVGLF